MFQNIALFSKQYNIFSDPGPHWTPKVKIYCTCHLETGFGSVLRWTRKNPIKLTAMISLYKQLSQACDTKEPTSGSFKIDPLITIKWKTAGVYNIIVQVYTWQHYVSSSREELLIEKALSHNTVRDYCSSFFENIMRILTMADASAITLLYARKMYGEKIRSNAEFEIGQRVSTIIGPNVKTLRTGYVISWFYHQNKQAYMYFLIVDGEVRTKRYFAEDLRLA